LPAIPEIDRLNKQLGPTAKSTASNGRAVGPCRRVRCLGGAFRVGILLQGLTSGVSSRDPATLIAVTGLMTVVACLACLVPAVRAIRLDPVVALRVE